jgi:hypothetical protein
VRSHRDINLIPFAVAEFGSLGGHATAFFDRVGQAGSRLQRDVRGLNCSPLGAEIFLSLSMSLTRTTSCVGCPPPRTMLKPLLPRLGCFLLPRRSLPAPCILARRVRRRMSPPRVVFFSVGWEFLVFSYVPYAGFHPFAVPWIPLPSCHSCSLGPPFIPYCHILAHLAKC